MKINQLRDFVAVAENGSLRAAARALGLAQPAITRSIQELEFSLGTQLFIREARGVRLTETGETLLERAVVILGEIKRARDTVHQQQGGVEGELTIGSSIAGHLGVLVDVLAPFRRRFPNVKLTVVEGFFPTLEADLRSGQVDLYVGPIDTGRSSGDLTIEHLFDNTRVVIGRKNHPLSDAKSLSDLTTAAWLTTSITQNAGDELNTVFAERGLPPPVLACQSMSALSILTVLMSSDLLAMAPIQWAESPVLRTWLAPIHLNETFQAPPIFLVTKAGLGTTPAAEHFIQLVKNVVRQHNTATDTVLLSTEGN